MSEIPYHAPAGLYHGIRKSFRRGGGGQGLTFRRFPTLIEAIACAMETKAGPSGFVSIELDDRDLDADEIRRLYKSDEFALARSRRKPRSRPQRRADISGT